MKSKYTAIVTADPQEAIRLVEEERPHLVLPGGDGMDPNRTSWRERRRR